MLNPSEFDQAMAEMREVTPRIWWNLYDGCLAAGFTPQQAISLVQTYILSQGQQGTRPDSSVGGAPPRET